MKYYSNISFAFSYLIHKVFCKVYDTHTYIHVQILSRYYINKIKKNYTRKKWKIKIVIK